VARRRLLVRARIEPPAWYRGYDPAAWDEPDGHELAMIDGMLAGVRWPECADGSAGWLEFHDHHSRRRWGQAKYQFEREHPDLAEQEFNDIRARRAERRSAR
jgi:hypothetical protein